MRLPTSIDLGILLVCLLPWGLSPVWEETLPELIFSFWVQVEEILGEHEDRHRYYSGASALVVNGKKMAP